ncbi:MAG: NAD(P)-dependent oxidoreductase [Saprospiraceae bacterium]
MLKIENKFKILIAETKDFSREALSALQDMCLVTMDDIAPSSLPQVLQNYDVLWFRLGFQIMKENLPDPLRCKYIVCPVTGLDHIDLNACEKAGIKVLSLRGETAFLREVRATAEHTIGLTLALLRLLPQAVSSVKQLTWDRDRFKGHEIYGKTVGILGVGRLGSITAGYFKAMGAHVIGYDIVPFDETICEPVADMESLLEQSDIISIHVNYNKANHHLLSFNAFSKMKRGSILINTARGGVVNSEALIQALKNETLKGAAIDVVEQEFDAANDLVVRYAQSNDHLIITPHIGGNTVESFAKTELFMVQKLRHALNSIHA